MSKKRRFGRVRQLPSGRWQARHLGPDGSDRAAPETFGSKTDAEVWLTLKEAEILNGDWTNPDDGKIPLADYAQTWIAERPGLRPKTVELYSYLLRKHIAPVLGGLAIADIQASKVLRWRKQLIDSGVSAVTVAKAYRLLKAVLNTALDDGVIRRNPCRIKGASEETSPERPVLSVTQVYTLAEAIDPRYRALVLLAAFASLRWGELAALRRSDFDLTNRTIRVERQLTEVAGQGLTFGPPKSAAGRRTVPLLSMIVTDLADHLDQHAQDGDDGLIFTSPEGAPLRHGNFTRRVWLPAVGKAGLSGVHFHDLRHAGNTYTANAGANLRELMERMGHSTNRAAMIYLHSTDPRQRALADAVDKAARDELRQARKWPPPIGKPAQDNGSSGTEVARDHEQGS
jgi:integrase